MQVNTEGDGTGTPRPNLYLFDRRTVHETAEQSVRPKFRYNATCGFQSWDLVVLEECVAVGTAMPHY